MRLSFIGSSLVSCYWNGAATYYRGLLRALAARGHQITFLEPDAFGRQQNRDMPDPDWAKVVVYPGVGEDGVRRCLDAARGADVVVLQRGAEDLPVMGLNPMQHSRVEHVMGVAAASTRARLEAQPSLVELLARA